MPRDSRSRSPLRKRERSSRQPEESRRRYRDDRDDSIEGRREYRERKRYKDDYEEGSRRSYGRRDSERERSSERRQGENDRRYKERSGERDRRRRDDYDDKDRGGDKRDKKRYGERNEQDDRQEGPSNSRRPPDSPSPSRSQSQSAVDDKDKDKGKPNFKNSGLLAAATNTVKLTDGSSTVLKYNEPPEARKPTDGWRLYIFKGEEQSGQYELVVSCFANS